MLYTIYHILYIYIYVAGANARDLIQDGAGWGWLFLAGSPLEIVECVSGLGCQILDISKLLTPFAIYEIHDI